MSEEHGTEGKELEASTESGGLHRRHFLRNAALAGMTAAWSAPLMQTVAFAHHPDNPPPGSPFTPGECKDSEDTPDHDKYSKDSNNSRDSRDTKGDKNSKDSKDYSKDSDDSKDGPQWF